MVLISNPAFMTSSQFIVELRVIQKNGVHSKNIYFVLIFQSIYLKLFAYIITSDH